MWSFSRVEKTFLDNASGSSNFTMGLNMPKLFIKYCGTTLFLGKLVGFFILVTLAFSEGRTDSTFFISSFTYLYFASYKCQFCVLGLWLITSSSPLWQEKKKNLSKHYLYPRQPLKMSALQVLPSPKADFLEVPGWEAPSGGGVTGYFSKEMCSYHCCLNVFWCL